MDFSRLGLRSLDEQGRDEEQDDPYRVGSVEVSLGGLG
jgi:hypothetical protein